MPDRRRQRQQRVRHDAGDSQNSVGASNRDPEPEKPCAVRSHKPAGSGVAYAEPKQYESVTVMPDKEVVEPQKYHRKGVLSNWSRYDEIAADEPEEGEDYQVGEDFSLILEQQANCTGGYLRLKGESSWDKEEASILTSHGLGALHVADLVASINTLPLYTQLNIPEELLPVSVIEFYTQLAEDNRKLYKPSQGYKDCSEVHEKLIQSLLISESEPLTLGSEEPEIMQSTKNAVDVALSLTEAFAPEPEDVDLNTLLREQSIEKEASPVHEPSQVNDKKSSREPTPVKQTTRPDKSRETTPAKEVTESLKSAQVIDSAGITNKQTTSKNQHALNNHTDLAKEKNPTSFDFGLSKVSTSVSTKSNKDVKDIADKIAISDPLKIEESVTEELGAPSVDLDAPLESSNPVIISKTETEDLEDWLDSVLDD